MQREHASLLIQRSNNNTMIYSIEDMVTRVLPNINLPLFQKIRGKKQWEPLKMDIPAPDSLVRIMLKSAQECVNVAPIYEDAPEEAHWSQNLLRELMQKMKLSHEELINSLIDPATYGKVPDKLAPYLCYLPHAKQSWNSLYIRPSNVALMQAAFPLEQKENLKKLLLKGLSYSDIEQFNAKIHHELLSTESHFYWLSIRIEQSMYNLTIRDLVKVEADHAEIIRRRLIEDDAL